jgi:putative two-component system response regulator
MFARNGADALRLAEGDPQPDIVLLDVIMPGMNGYEACRRLRESPRTCDIPVIFITAQDDGVDEATGLALGAQDYIKKPFNAALVRNRVAIQLELKRHRDNLNGLVRERTEQLALTQEVTIHSMATLAEWRDPETGAHIRRTQNYVRLLAERMTEDPRFSGQLPRDFISWLCLSAPLHDVGKVAIPDAVLHKPGRLTAEEFEIMKEHTTFGYRLLALASERLGENSFLSIAADIAYGHHERWDGKGYPRKLRGEEIPLSARLMSVADVYDALRSKRVYKSAKPHGATFEIMRRGRGSQFDPDVFDAFDRLQAEFQAVADRFQD